jgi:hypothetical protein
MRNLLVAGAAGVLLTMGAGAAYASNPNVPNWSPYAIMAYDPNGPTYVNPGHGDNYGYPPRYEPGSMGEGRAAFIDPDYNPNYSGGSGYAPNWGDRPSGYDNTRENSAYPSGFGDSGSRY